MKDLTITWINPSKDKEVLRKIGSISEDDIHIGPMKSIDTSKTAHITEQQCINNSRISEMVYTSV